MVLQFLDHDGCVVGKLIGRMDVYNAETLKSRCHILIKEGRRSLILDLSEVAYTDSAGIGALVTIDHWLGQYGRSLALYKPSPVVARLLEVMGLDTVFHRIPDIALAPKESPEKDAEWRKAQRIVLFSNRAGLSRQVRDLLVKEGFGLISEVDSPAAAHAVLNENRVNLVVVDLGISVESVLEFTDGLLGTNLNLPIIHAGFDVLSQPVDDDKTHPGNRQSFLTLVMSGLMGEEMVFFDLLRYRLDRKGPKTAFELH